MDRDDGSSSRRSFESGARAGQARSRGVLRLLFAVAVAVGAARPVSAGQSRCWIDKGALVAPAAFGDIAGDFIIDLAAPVSQLHVTRAQLDGVATDGGDRVVLVRQLRFGGRTFAATPMVVENLDDRTRAFDTTINGVIGADLLRRFVVVIDPAPCRIRLLRRAATPKGAVRLPVTMIAGAPRVPALVTDGASTRPGLFALGTGRWTTVVDDAALSRPPSNTDTPVRLRGLELAGRLFEQIPAEVRGGSPGARAEAGGASGDIGMAILSRWRVTLDMAGGWVALDPGP